ncbi:hypothetical protein PRIPAC_81427 [Pristionchus pacificus]|uniref:Uncharacterized protein n=1 Tax=Pristionchus pacificus TaxID=54126 RepID=A0A2A6CKW9_PRIPA|nr:hypothetical protein PRIPAC_81427 [Pristionchus pacificus]|eukprot:PDM78750.1 hypothetical protein PRIPAC_31329 [Pristionchus pacificus]
MSVDVVDSVLAAARVGEWGGELGKKEGGWDDTNKRKESLLDDTEEAGNEFHRVMENRAITEDQVNTHRRKVVLAINNCSSTNVYIYNMTKTDE